MKKISKINKFWEDWKNKTEIETKIIQELEKTENILKKQTKILSIYVKGTFPRRETIQGSDVDLVLIFKEKNYEEQKNKIKQELKQKELNKISLSAYSTEELKTGKTHQGKNTTRFSKHIDEYELLIGKKLNSKELKKRTNKQDFEKMIKAFQEIFLPKYKEKEMSFHDIIKQVFWLTDNELRHKKIKPKNKWLDLKNQTQKINPEHIIMDAYKFREQKAQNKEITMQEKKEFIKKLKKHLKELKKQII